MGKDDTEEDEDDRVIRAFQFFEKLYKDTDNKEDLEGKITCVQFRDILESRGYRLNQKFVDRLFKECELRNRGELEYKSFVKNWREKNPDANEDNVDERIDAAVSPHFY